MYVSTLFAKLGIPDPDAAKAINKNKKLSESVKERAREEEREVGEQERGGVRE